MANSQLQGKSYEIDPIHHKYLGASSSYEALKMHQSRMSKAKDLNNTPEFDRYGGDATLKYIGELLTQDRNVIKTKKKVGMDAGRENEFLGTHEKDRDNANPTGVGGVPMMHKGSINRKIMSNKEVYNESFDKEISSIKYLMEYMNVKK
jgi:hypothetical protein